VCGSLKSLFNEWQKGIELGLVRENEKLSGQVMFNSGVLLFHKSSPFLIKWIKACDAKKEYLMGDQDVLTELILQGDISYKELSNTYNWLMFDGALPGAIIVHWAGGWGKEYIRKFGGIHSFKRCFAAKRV
jgi:lipopolysaccharide biosynthesis glycosyltransferase